MHWAYDEFVVPVYYIYAVDSFKQRASLIFTEIEILPNLSILAILCIMADWGLLGLKFLSVVSGLRMEFSSRTSDGVLLCLGHLGDAHFNNPSLLANICTLIQVLLSLLEY
jgi:hypothetical protein